MQNIFLDITAPGSLPQRQWIRNDYIVQVGSSELLDVSIPIDDRLAPKHFALHANQGGCVVRDLDSGHGTRVNCMPVALQRLNDGDVIEAGRTRFVIRMNGDAVDSSVPAPSAGLPAGALTDDQFAWEADQLESGVFCIRPVDPDKYPLPELTEHLTARYKLYLAINKQALGWSVEQTHPYLKGLPEIHPFVAMMADDDTTRQMEIFDETSERKATTAIFSVNRYDDMLRQLAVFGSSFCLPTIFATQIESAPEPFASRLMDSNAAVLLADDKPSWRCYCSLDPDADWQRLGLIRPPTNVRRSEPIEADRLAN